MRRITVIAIAVSCIALTGCSAQRSHPDYSLFNNVPPNHLEKVKSAIQTSGIQNFELPTKFPYPVTQVNIPSNGELPHQLDLFFGDSTHFIDLTARKVPQNAVISQSSVVMQQESQTKLSDGTKALYGNNGAASQLAWDKNGVFYLLESTTDKNKSDLTEQQLVDVASSFQ